MGRKKKIDNIKQIDGRLAENQAEVKKPKYRSLDEIFGYQGATYKTLEEAEYITSLANMNKIDLQKECYRVHLMPNDDRTIMSERLTREFRRTVNAINTARLQPIKLKVSARGAAILAEGANRPGI